MNQDTVKKIEKLINESKSNIASLSELIDMLKQDKPVKKFYLRHRFIKKGNSQVYLHQHKTDKHIIFAGSIGPIDYKDIFTYRDIEKLIVDFDIDLRDYEAINVDDPDDIVKAADLVNQTKFYLRAKNVSYVFEEGKNYLNLNVDNNNISLDTNHQDDRFKTKFTNDDIEELKKLTGSTLDNFIKINVLEDQYEQ